MIKTKKSILIALVIVLCAVSYLGICASESIVKMHIDDPAPDGSRFKNTDEGVVAVMLDVKGGKFVGHNIQ
jgi:major membrane immunogen (membrane-anchored lipoprotein)